MILYPAIDLKDGRCVRLVRGEMARATVFNDDPTAQAALFAAQGFSYLHILSPCVTFDKTHRTYQNLGMQVRDLPEDHDPSDRLAAMRLAMDDAAPALGLYYREERPTLGDALDSLVEKAGGELPGKPAAKPARKAARR